MTVMFDVDGRTMPDGTVLLFGIRFEGQTDKALVYTYVMLKVKDRWHVTGSGRSPQDAGWGAVERWLTSNGRQVLWVQRVTWTELLWDPSGATPLDT